MLHCCRARRRTAGRQRAVEQSRVRGHEGVESRHTSNLLIFETLEVLNFRKINEATRSGLFLRIVLQKHTLIYMYPILTPYECMQKTKSAYLKINIVVIGISVLTNRSTTTKTITSLNYEIIQKGASSHIKTRT